MTPEEIVEKFANALKQFEPIDGQPSNTDLTRIQEVVAPLLLQISYDEAGGTHTLIGLIWPVGAYTPCYGATFIEPTHVGAYKTTIDGNDTTVVCARTEAVHKAKCADRGTYETAQQETTQFILTVVEDTWVPELRDPETIYTDVATKALLANLQAGGMGRYAIDLLALHNEMQHYHLEVYGIPNYINMLKDAQKQAGSTGRKIADKMVLLFASTEMFTAEHYTRSNNHW